MAVEIVITARDNASRVIQSISSSLGALGRSAASAIGTGLKAATAGAVAAIGGLGAGFGLAVRGGLELNSSMEQVSARLLAFTKDAGETERLLAQLRQEAAQTPFAFDEMANAMAGLLPAAKGAGVEVMELIKTAEILAALNPAEGLEGAQVALREALSGDWVSLQERFNIPKQAIQELKDQGLSNLDIVRGALTQLGADGTLVSNMAQTMSGRWSTFMDTIDTLKGSLSQPLFDLLKSGLERLQPILDANMPRLQEIATLLGNRLAGALRELGNRALPILVRGWGLLRDSVATFQEAFAGNWIDAGADEIHGLHRIVGNVATVLGDVSRGIATFKQLIEDGAPPLASFKAVLSTLIPPELMAQITPLIDTVADAIGRLPAIMQFVSDNAEAFKGALVGIGAAIAGAGILGAVISLGAAIGALLNPVTLLVAGAALLGAAWAANWGGIQEKTAAAWAVLQPLLEQLGTWITTVAIPALVQFGMWLGENIPLGMARVAEFWNGTLMPALAQLGTWWYGQALPALQELAVWLGETLVTTFGTLKTAWDTVLYPPLNAFWVFLRDDLLPLNAAFNRVLTEIRDVAAVAVKAAWDNYLQPALKGLWDKLTEADRATKQLMSPLGELRTLAEGALATALQNLGRGAIGLIISEFGRLKSLIQELIGFLNTLADKIASIKPPSLGGGGGDTGSKSFGGSPSAGGGGGASSNAGKGFASGGDFIVPPGYPNDSYPMRVSSGERVQVTPAGQASGSGPMIGEVHIHNDMDLERLAYEVTRIQRLQGA
jgi:hypothetical protein